MFKIDNKAIGIYISGLIDSKFSSAREFCRQWLKLDGEEINDDTVRNKANKLSQIKNGSKGIQTYDLPAFSELLCVSFEEILSGGMFKNSQETRPTNFSTARSNNETEWLNYIKRKDTPILNSDEFGNNILDYALYFKNYNFIKFLINKGYIWFDNKNSKHHFEAGTNIKRIIYNNSKCELYVRTLDKNGFEYKLLNDDSLRIKIISLAADYGDLEMIKKLNSRETPLLYYEREMGMMLSNSNWYNDYDANAIKHIANSNNKILSYFTDSFTIYNDYSEKKTFIFPYISELLDAMISVDSHYTNMALKKMIEYNKAVYNKINDLKILLNKDRQYNSTVIKFYDTESIVALYDRISMTKFLTNIAKATHKSKSDETNELVEALNRTYKLIRNMKVND